MRTHALTLLLLLAACRVPAVESVPLTGTAPATIAIWPSVAEPFMHAQGTLLADLGPAVGRRGYGVVSPAVAQQLLTDAEAWVPGAPPSDLAAAARMLDADAVLVFDVRAFEDQYDAARGRYLRASWDFAWRLLSLRGEGLLWEHQHRGVWNRPVDDREDPMRRDNGALESVMLFGDGRWHFRDRRELLANLHFMALRLLPQR